ncbi:MlaD family protein [Rhodococcus koreensis]
MNLSRRTRQLLCAASVSAVVLTVPACSLGPDDLPSVRGGVGDTYDLSLEFASVMNLPAGADVMMDGLRVGEVRSLQVSGSTVTVSAGIGSGTRIPADARAIVRQDTLLGDTYIAVTGDGEHSADGYLPAGGTIPVARTISPPQLEDTIAVLANFVNGGSIQRIEDVMARVNAVVPPLPAVRDVASVAALDMQDLAARTQEIDRTLTGLNETALSFDDRTDALSAMFDSSSVHYWRRLAISVVSHIGQILPSVGSVYEGGLWMVPMLNTLADTGDVARDVWDEGPDTTVVLSRFLRSRIVPFAQKPSVEIEGIESAGGEQIVADAENLLRMLGAVK